MPIYFMFFQSGKMKILALLKISLLIVIYIKLTDINEQQPLLVN